MGRCEPSTPFDAGTQIHIGNLPPHSTLPHIATQPPTPNLPRGEDGAAETAILYPVDRHPDFLHRINPYPAIVDPEVPSRESMGHPSSLNQAPRLTPFLAEESKPKDTGELPG